MRDISGGINSRLNFKVRQLKQHELHSKQGWTLVLRKLERVYIWTTL